MERWLSGRKRQVANLLYGCKAVSRVQIPPSPHIKITQLCWVILICGKEGFERERVKTGVFTCGGKFTKTRRFSWERSDFK